MPLIVQQWSTDPNSNSNPPPNGAPEGMFGDQVNDTMRVMMASQREIYNGLGGILANQPGGFDLETPDALQAVAWQAANAIQITPGSTANFNYGDLTVAGDKVTALPINSIVLWYGLAASVPAGWAICDGLNGTPDMRGNLPRGAAADEEVTGVAVGSATSGASGAHTHTINGTALTLAQMPAHEHLISNNDSRNPDTDPLAASNYLVRTGFGVGEQRYILGGSNTAPVRGRTSSSGSSSSHTHTAQAVGDHSHTIEPPAQRLHFIMRIS